MRDSKLVPDDNGLFFFGASVSVKGGILAVGDDEYGSGARGSVFVYEYNQMTGKWTEFGNSILNGDCDLSFGTSLAVLEDGALAIGCTGDESNTGAVYHYIRSVFQGQEQYTLQQKVTASDGTSSDYFGWWGQTAVYGNVMVIGAYGAPCSGGSGSCGKVYVYARPTKSEI